MYYFNMLFLVEQAMCALHRMGVVHMDWYLSNFLWRYNISSGEVDIKIIDFDSAYIIADGLSSDGLVRVSGRRKFLADKFGGSDNAFNYDVSLMEVLKRNKDDKFLQSNDKKVLDFRFKELQEDALL
jgi:hypothetical protein